MLRAGRRVVVFHTAVRHAQDYHCVKLLGDDGLRRLGAKVGRRHVEHRRQVDVLDARLDGVTETAVDGDRDARAGQGGRRAQAQSAVLELFANGIDAKGADVEGHAVAGIGS